MFDVPCFFWQTHSWMTVVYRTEVWSIGMPHVWCEVQSLVSQQLSAPAQWVRAVRWKAKVVSSLTDVWQQLFEQQDITVICTVHFHPWLHENHTSASVSRDTDWNRHAGTCLSETNERRQWAEAASDWNVVNNQKSFIDQGFVRQCSRNVALRVEQPSVLNNFFFRITIFCRVRAWEQKVCGWGLKIRQISSLFGPPCSL